MRLKTGFWEGFKVEKKSVTFVTLLVLIPPPKFLVFVAALLGFDPPEISNGLGSPTMARRNAGPPWGVPLRIKNDQQQPKIRKRPKRQKRSIFFFATTVHPCEF